MITRTLEKAIQSKFFRGKAIVLIGPRQTGKTTLIKKILEAHRNESLILDGDDPSTQSILSRPNLQQLKQIIGRNSIMFIDEAQRIHEIGLTVKIVIDQLPDVQVILSGSSAFELANQTSEPLTGRKWTNQLWPISWQEWQDHVGYVKAEQDLENRLVFGFYPDVLNHPHEGEIVLKELAESYLYKDVLIFGNLKKPTEIQKLVQALAYQLGNEVSYAELGQIVGIDPKTIDRYITILEQAKVVYRLAPLSRNLRNEIKSNRKIYFYDNGIRNAIIGQLQPMAIRQDVGALWENFLMSERLKAVHYHQLSVNSFFWRTRQQQEVDYVEERDGNFFGYEFKWNERRKVKFPKTFTETYKADNMIVNRANFRNFILLE